MLDLGCGAGRHTLYLTKRGFDVYAFDRSKLAIRNLKILLKKESLDADLKVWDMLKPLPYDKNFFDIVIATRVIHHTYTKRIIRIFSDIERVLKEKGLLFLQIPSYREYDPSIGGSKNSKWIEPGTLVPLKGEERGVPHHFFKRREILSMLKNYKILYMHSGKSHYHGYCIIAKKQRIRNLRS